MLTIYTWLSSVHIWRDPNNQQRCSLQQRAYCGTGGSCAYYMKHVEGLPIASGTWHRHQEKVYSEEGWNRNGYNTDSQQITIFNLFKKENNFLRKHLCYKWWPYRNELSCWCLAPRLFIIRHSFMDAKSIFPWSRKEKQKIYGCKISLMSKSIKHV